MAILHFNCFQYHFTYDTKGFTRGGFFSALGASFLLLKTYALSDSYMSQLQETTEQYCNSPHQNSSFTATQLNEIDSDVNCWKYSAFKALQYTLIAWTALSFTLSFYSLASRLRKVPTGSDTPLLQ